MIRKNLHQWQFETYSEFHQNPVNQKIHIVFVPIFWLGSFLLIYFLYTEPRFFWIGLGMMLSALVAEGIGHKKETKDPIPFLGPLDFVSRFFMEQFVTYPRWFFSKK